MCNVKEYELQYDSTNYVLYYIKKKKGKHPIKKWFKKKKTVGTYILLLQTYLRVETVL